ncbi:hypothetical protein Msi02_16100 [Microbispora siamensis]|uniref:Uncharacterized protein n=1 Tax=Microbispora siamensis TaxID=564413 RepID=A0ABQ4GH94_9ACTN|nr:hypothetical protein Msi02_16100 [Microbispora siamensis]
MVPERTLGSGERTGMGVAVLGVSVLIGEPFGEINHLVVLLLASILPPGRGGVNWMV